MANVLKIVFLGIIGFGILIYFTAPEQPSNKKEIINKTTKVTLSTLPNYFEIIGGGYMRKQELFKGNEESFIVVLNHDSLSLLESLNKNVDKKMLLVANISNTPWFIKKLAVNGKLEELNLNSKVPFVNDGSGELINALNLKDDTQNKYFIYKVNKDNSIVKISESSVKEGALENGLSTLEIQDYVNSLLKQLK